LSNIVLQAEGLTKSYNKFLAVNDLSLTVYSGEVFGFLGPNGAGKTTSINMMCGLLKPDRGQVIIQGQPIINSKTEIRGKIGVCPQEITLWKKLTCMEQLQFIGEMYSLKHSEIHQRCRHLLDELDLNQEAHKLVRTLSGGMQRRLNLAMALIHNPEIVILDEPEVGLDPQSRVRMREYIKTLAQTKTIILTSHNMDEVDRLADRVAIIDQGELLVLDTPKALKNSVGEGDVLELSLEDQSDRAQDLLTDLDDRAVISRAEGFLQIRALDIVNLLPLILEKLTSAEIHPGEVRLRANTLEDVFIQLTGRRLRE
jgi:ABC-2 type transport system ATP-binding protein